MNHQGLYPSTHGLEQHGLCCLRNIYWNLTGTELVEHSLQREKSRLSDRGSLVVTTGKRTGRSPNDKFIVESEPSKSLIDWGKVNVPISRERFNRLRDQMIAYLEHRDVYVQDLWAGSDPRYRMPVRVIAEYAWHSLFARTLLVRPEIGGTTNHQPEFTIIALPEFFADPADHGTRSEAFVVIDFEQKMVMIGGTKYAGEIKKSVFTILNHLLPDRQVLPMHCSANIGSRGDTALFFGLSGTGKTTLSADPLRKLIGDDEHGWSNTGVFNFEGGCYAKCINLSQENEPQIYNALRFGSVLENVIIDPHARVPDFDDDSLTENTRAAYPLEHIDNAVFPSVGGHPQNVVFLTCDAFGVFPPISRLSGEQALYQFLSGYTAKVAGTEAGVTEPQTTFSTLFGAPFFTQRPMVYAQLMGERLQQHRAQCWLVNTGWSGGPYGVGQRMKLAHTRRMLNAALAGELEKVPYVTDPVFGLSVPGTCPDVPTQVLQPRNTWADPSAYDRKAAHLSQLFKENFKKFQGVTDAIRAAGPR